MYALVLKVICILENYCVTFKLYRIDSYRHMYNPLFRICFRCVPILVSFLWISNSSNLLIWIELYMIVWNPCILLLLFHSKSEYICERFVLGFVLSRKGTCTFRCSACASDICYLLLKLPSYTLVCGIVWTFARNGKGYALFARYVGSRYEGYSGPLPEMVKGMRLLPAMWVCD